MRSALSLSKGCLYVGVEIDGPESNQRGTVRLGC